MKTWQDEVVLCSRIRVESPRVCLLSACQQKQHNWLCRASLEKEQSVEPRDLVLGMSGELFRRVLRGAQGRETFVPRVVGT